MMNVRVFALLTAAVVLSFLYFQTRKIYRVYEIEISGDEKFRESVERILRESGVHFAVVDDSNIVFDQRNSTLRVGGSLYHLTWSEDVLERVRSEIERLGLDISEIEFVPMDGLDGVLRCAADVIRKGFSDGFSNGYLFIPMEIVDSSGNVLFTYDPKLREFRYR